VKCKKGQEEQKKKRESNAKSTLKRRVSHNRGARREFQRRRVKRDMQERIIGNSIHIILAPPWTPKSLRQVR
jgi:hypothetical protein